MASFRTLTLAQRGLMLALVALAIVGRVLVPTGWMPVAQQNGVTISLCTGMGAAEMVLAPDGTLHEKVPAPHDGHGDHPCAFAGASAAVEAPSLVAMLPVIPPRAVPGFARHLDGAVGRGLAAPPPPQTGPPILI